MSTEPMTVELEMKWEDYGSYRWLRVGPALVGDVSLASDGRWREGLKGTYHPTREAAQSALEAAVRAMGVASFLQPVSDHTKRLTAWMRKRAGNADLSLASGRGWHDGLMEIADEIEANEMERCGHADPSLDTDRAQEV